MDFQQTNILSMTGNDDFATAGQLANYVDLTSAQTISGLKTFSTLPVSSVVPTTTTQLVNKSYVDGLGAGYVDLTSAQTITGAKTFNANVRLRDTRQLIFGTTTGGVINFTGAGMYYDNQAGGSHYFFVSGTPIADIDSTGLVIRTSKKLNFYNGSWIYEDGAGSHLDYNTPTGYYHSFRVNNVEQLRISSTTAFFSKIVALNTDFPVYWNGGSFIQEGATPEFRYETPYIHKFSIGYIDQLTLDATLGATFSGGIRMKAGQAIYPDDTFLGGAISSGGSGGIRFDADTGGNFRFINDSTLALTIEGANITIPSGNTFTFGVVGSNITYFGGTTLRYNLPTGKTHALRINATNILEVLATGIKTTGGYYMRTGSGGAFGTSVFNNSWVFPNLTAWVDTTNIGNYTISDARIKKNIVKARPILDRLSKLSMIEYNYIENGIFQDDGVLHYGYIAQEIKAEFPEFPNLTTGEETDMTDDGNIQPIRVNAEFSNLFMGATIELNAKVEAMQKVIEAQQKQIETQQAQIDGLLVAMAKLVSQQIV